ncbi:MAG: dipeptidase [Chloroflexota bacterium]
MNNQVTTYLQAAKQRQLDELIEWLSIPSISTLTDHADDMEKAAQWLVDNMQAAGVENIEMIRVESEPKEDEPVKVNPPLIYGDWLHAGDDKPTVLIYGHYDVQPVDPLDLWETPPFEPSVRPSPKAGEDGDNLYARGSSDDKGQTFIHVKAVEALLSTTGSLPVNVKFLIEGQEESGGAAIKKYLPANLDKLAADVCLISDTGMLTATQPLLVYGLRGMCTFEITVTGPTTDLHSGMYGGAIHNANQALCELLAALHDKDGHITVPGFYDNVRVLDDEERASLAKVPYREAELLNESGAPAAYGEPDFTVVERIGARPTLEINGMWGGFIEKGFKTVIPSVAHAKVSCRIVPNQEPKRIVDLVESYLQALAPETVTVSVKASPGSPAFLSPISLPELQAAGRAFERVFGVEPIFNVEGGSIPVVVDMQTHLKAPVVLMGFGLPDDNLHAPNEKFYLPNFYKGIETVIAFMGELVD